MDSKYTLGLLAHNAKSGDNAERKIIPTNSITDAQGNTVEAILYKDTGPGVGIVIPADEPLFILRAKDKLALALLEKYEKLAYKAGCERDFIMAIHKAMERFASWQSQIENNSKIKLPD
jgi:hypothetical protein